MARPLSDGTIFATMEQWMAQMVPNQSFARFGCRMTGASGPGTITLGTVLALVAAGKLSLATPSCSGLIPAERL